MAKTVIVCNPLGTNITPLLPLFLRGTVAEWGDTVVDLGYLNQTGIQNIIIGAELLDQKLRNITGEILVFGYSEGAQVGTYWLREYAKGNTRHKSFNQLEFLFIGNSERRYGGCLYKHEVFGLIADVGGLGDDPSPYKITDIARQYDGFADFPTGGSLDAAVDAIESVFEDEKAIENTFRSFAQLFFSPTSTDEWQAITNAVVGMALVHPLYLDVAVDDADIVWHTDPADPNVDYGWKPSYPVPLLGIGVALPSQDRELRTQIERAYSRPVQIPMPAYLDQRARQARLREPWIEETP